MYYDPIYYYDKTENFPSVKEQLGYWLGPTTHCGNAMTYYILAKNDKVIGRKATPPGNDAATINHSR